MLIFKKLYLAIIISILFAFCSSSFADVDTSKETIYFNELTTLIGEVILFNYNTLNNAAVSYQQDNTNSQYVTTVLTSILALNSSIEKKYKKIIKLNKLKNDKNLEGIFSLTDKCTKSFIDYIKNNNKKYFDKYQKYYTLLESNINELLKEN